ncbi:MAG: hydantoinase/oxoprolinase family protein, partial [Actinomycetota bacterium]
MSRGRLRIGIDTGGTFTDVVALDAVSGEVHTTKTPSTPHDPSVGFAEGVRLILDQIGAEIDEVDTVSHGTTVATNALLQDNVVDLGLLTTEGFRDILEIARQSVPDGYGNSYFWVKPERIVPVHLVREAPGRLDAKGDEVRPLDEESIAASARWFREQGVTAIGICFLHAYVDPVHERRAREVVLAEYPEASVSISSDVLREYREYERTVTTLVDAFVKGTVVDYVNTIEERLAELRPDDPPPFYVMKSNGGVVSPEGVGRQPITTILSGPAAGALGAAMIAEQAGFNQVLTLDGGGTSTDVTVVRDGLPALTTEGRVGRHPTKVPMIDIVTVGTGGGSIAWISPEGGLKVGPRSAGAAPGPICYGTGGTEPTLTDAHLTLGRIPPALLGGRVPLDAAAAREGIETLATGLGMEAEDCAAGILEIAAWNQANAIRQVTVRKGLDVRDFAMVSFGGSGSLQACRLLDLLDLPAVIVPPDPGNVSAFGLLTVDVRNDEVQTYVSRTTAIDIDHLSGVYAELEERARLALDAEGFDRSEQRIERSADLRYDGQAFEVRVTAPDGEIEVGFIPDIVNAFHDEHEKLYDYCYRDRPEQVVELVNLRVAGVGPITTPTIRPRHEGDGSPERARTGSREVHLDGRWEEVPIF